VRQPGSEDTIRVSRTIIRYVMCSKEAILSADATLDARLQTSQSIAALRLRSVMCAPLLDSEGRPLGVIQLDTLEQQKKFLPTDLEVLASVAVQAGVAIHNAQLHEHALRQKALEQDLSLAYRVQKGFLPQRRPEYPGYEFYDFYEPANHVGGDYYDYILLPDGRTAVVVADVVGHGFAAAMLMANLAAEAKYCLASEAHPATALRKLNDRLRSIHTDRFVTLILAVLNPTTHEVTVVNAGHMPPIWRRVDGTLVELGTDKGGMPLGILEGYPYQQETIRLEPGDVLFMYTDGIHEAMNPAGEQYSLARVRRQLLAGGCGVRALSQALIADVRQFVSPAAPSDDMCLVGVTRQ
jgi:serine phosphatase RsbU (regulator of sigma subunit)